MSNAGRRRRRPSRPPRCTTSSIEHQSGRGSALPAWSRDRSRRLSHQPRRAAPLSVDDHGVELAPLVLAESVGGRARRPRVVIAVSGERRSCETERSNVVLTTLLRRSALVSITCASSSSRRRAAPTQRLERRDDAVAGARSSAAGVVLGGHQHACPMRLAARRSAGAPARRCVGRRPRRARPTRAGRSNACAIRCPTRRAATSSRLSPPSRSRAISAVEVRLAPRRARPPSARVRARRRRGCS